MSLSSEEKEKNLKTLHLGSLILRLDLQLFPAMVMAAGELKFYVLVVDGIAAA